MKHLLCSAVALVMIAGCTTVPQNHTRIYSALDVGDRGNVAFDEVIAAVPRKGGPMECVNIHVALSAIINPTQTTFSDIQDVQSIIFRLSPRISSAVVTVIQQEPALAEDMGVLRDSIAREANRVLSGEFSKWTSAGAYEVQIVVTSLYVTNGSVGRPAAGHQWWGW